MTLGIHNIAFFILLASYLSWGLLKLYMNGGVETNFVLAFQPPFDWIANLSRVFV